MASITNRILLGAATITLIFVAIVFGTPGMPGPNPADIATNTAYAQKVDQQATALLDQIEELYPAFGNELRELPEIKNSPQVSALADIKTLVQNLTPQQREAIEEMFNVGRPKSRKFVAPIQALYWLVEDQGLEKTHVTLSQGWKAIVESAWGSAGGTGWQRKTIQDFKAVTARLNDPWLLELYIKKRFTYSFPDEGYSAPPFDTFEKETGDCSDVATFGLWCLSKAGYNCDLYGGPTTYGGHVILVYKKDDKLWVSVDFRKYGNNPSGPFSKFSEMCPKLGFSALYKWNASVSPRSALITDMMKRSSTKVY
jgi:hypothetical protein